MTGVKLHFDTHVNFTDVSTNKLAHIKGYDRSHGLLYDVKCVVYLDGTTIAGSSNAGETHAGAQPHTTTAALAAGDLILVVTDTDSSPTAVTGLYTVASSGNPSALSDGFHKPGETVYTYQVRVHNDSQAYSEQDRMYLVCAPDGSQTHELGTDAVVVTEIGDHKLKKLEKIVDDEPVEITTSSPDSGFNAGGDLLFLNKTDLFTHTNFTCRENAGQGDIADDEKAMYWDLDSETLTVAHSTHSDKSRDVTITQGKVTSHRLEVTDTTTTAFTKTNKTDTAYVPVQILSNAHIGGGLHITGDLTLEGSITCEQELTTNGETSDIRLKTKIRDLDPQSSLSSLLSLQGIHYVLNNDVNQRDRFGFSAQEVETVFPELIRSNQEGYLRLDYIGFIAPLVEALKEQQNMITALQSRVEALEAGQ